MLMLTCISGALLSCKDHAFSYGLCNSCIAPTSIPYSSYMSEVNPPSSNIRSMQLFFPVHHFVRVPVAFPALQKIPIRHIDKTK